MRPLSRKTITLPSRSISRSYAALPRRTFVVRGSFRPIHTGRSRSSNHNPLVGKRSGVSGTTVAVALLLSLGAGYVANRISPSTIGKEIDVEKDIEIGTEEKHSSPSALPTYFDSHDAGMPGPTLEGRPGNLSAEQEVKLKEFWLATLEIFGVEHTSKNDSNTAPVPTEAAAESGGKKKKSRMSLFHRKHDDDSSSTTGTGADSTEDDKYGQNKEFKQALASQSPEALRNAFWGMVKHDNPDALLLRFLRARKWDVHKALVMLVSTMQWRMTEMHVDDDIMLHGEGGALRASKEATGTDRKDNEDFLVQLRMGKSFLHGIDAQGRPICVVSARLHKPGEQTEKSLERFTVYTIETARLMLRDPVDTATIIFDMTGFSLSNMDYTPVKFMIKCFEANYPESLGSVLVHRAPWLFSGIWKIIKGWLDPVVAAKVHFTDNEKELSEFVPLPTMMKALGGQEDWTYRYVEPVEGENARMADTEARDTLERDRKEMVVDYEKETIAWAKGGGNEQSGRQAIRERLAANYWQLDPMIRARSLYDRTGIMLPGGRLNFYPSTTQASGASQSRTGPPPTETSAGDVD